MSYYLLVNFQLSKNNYKCIQMQLFMSNGLLRKEPVIGMNITQGSTTKSVTIPV